MESSLASQELCPRLARQRLYSALQRVGLSFTDAASIVDHDPNAATAYWMQDAAGQDRIRVGPFVASLDPDCIEMVLRHEILHRSMYHAFGERFTNDELSNLTLDICINRLLLNAFPHKLREMSAAVYPDASRTTPVALADCTANPRRLPGQLGSLWAEIWGPGRDDALNPASLYYRLLGLGVAEMSGVITSRRHAPTAWPSPAMERAVDAVLGELRERLPEDSGLGRELSEFTVSPLAICTDRIEAFVRSIRVRRVAARVAEVVSAEFRSDVVVQPFPAWPSRLGLVYEATGLASLLCLHWNREPHASHARRAIAIYVDVSSSMIAHFPLVTAIVDALASFSLFVRSFDTAVRDVDVKEMSHGRLSGGGGTDFNPPVLDLAGDPEVSAGLLITDGFASLSPNSETALASSGKRLHVLYIRGAERAVAPDPLRHIAASTLEVTPGALTLRGG